MKKIFFQVSPGDLGSFSTSLLCAEPSGEPDKVGERIVGDLGVAVPTNIINQDEGNKKKYMLIVALINHEQLEACLSQSYSSER